LRSGGVDASIGEQILPAAPVRNGERHPFPEDPPGRRKSLAMAGIDQLACPAGGQLDHQRSAAIQAGEKPAIEPDAAAGAKPRLFEGRGRSPG